VNKIRVYVNLIVALAICAAFGAMLYTLADVTGLWRVYQAETRARQAEAQARKLEAEAHALRERQAMLQTSVVAFASLKDSLLVTITYIGGGLALLLVVIVNAVLMLERGRDKLPRGEL